MYKDPIEIFIGAPPRCGNTYLMYALKDMFNKPVKVVGEHRVQTLARHVLDQEPRSIFVTPVRDPFDAALSRLVWLAFEKEEWLNTETLFPALEQLTIYWELVLASPEKFTVIDFNKLIVDKNSLQGKLSERYPELLPHGRSILASDAEIKALLLKDDIEVLHNDEAEIQARGHIPRSDSRYKALAAEVLSGVMCKKRLEYLDSMYKQLLEIAI